MKKLVLFLMTFVFVGQLLAQELYFPPLTGSEWASISPAELNWCEDKIPDLYDFLEATNSKAFLVLKDGKIVLEKYFGDFTQDSIWYWASAGKSLTATAIGIAQKEGLLSIDDPTSDYLGAGWTSLSPEQEKAITIRHQLTMTSGLDDTSFDCTDPACLQYLAAPGTRWAYHNAPYTLLTNVIAAASGQTYNSFLNTRIHIKTGMVGAFIPSGNNQLYFSRARTMARFGLTILHQGKWGNTAVLDDSIYLDQMLHTSQDLNLAYGYLWWLNGSDSYRIPQSQILLPGQAIPDAPEELVAALGKNGQILNIIPSEKLLVIRLGENPGGNFLVGTTYNSEIWKKLNPILCTTTTTKELSPTNTFSAFPNPVQDQVQLKLPAAIQQFELYLFDQVGRLRWARENKRQLDLSELEAGSYVLQLRSAEGTWAYLIQKL